MFFPTSVSTWHSEERPSEHVTCLLKSSRGLSCHSQKAHSSHPGLQGFLHPGWQLTLWFHLLPPCFAPHLLCLSHSGLCVVSRTPRLVPAEVCFWNGSTFSDLHDFLHHVRFLLKCYHMREDFLVTLLKRTPQPSTCAPYALALLGISSEHLRLWVLHWLLRTTPSWNTTSSGRQQTHCLLYLFLCPQLWAQCQGGHSINSC